MEEMIVWMWSATTTERAGDVRIGILLSLGIKTLLSCFGKGAHCSVCTNALKLAK